MKLKYYLRGLGIGIVVTAIVMSVALGEKQPMTDEEVVARAKELGMIENTVLKELDNKESKEPEQLQDLEETTEFVADENEGEEQGKVQEEVQEETEIKLPETDDKKTEEAEKETVVEKPDAEESATITVSVVSGDSSWSVAKRMEEAGLVDSAKEFDAYLCQNGYDKKISVGTYEIATTATLEEMAKKITKSK